MFGGNIESSPEGGGNIEGTPGVEGTLKKS